METTNNIKRYLKHKSIPLYKFLESIGKSNGYLNSTKNFSLDTLEDIIKLYPDLNIDWLITGKGEMIKTETSPINVDGDLNTIDMENKLRKTEALLDAMIEQNERLKAELAEYKAREIQSKGIA